MLTWNCLNGYFHFPSMSSLSEELPADSPPVLASGALPELLSIYHLLGDPALNLR